MARDETMTMKGVGSRLNSFFVLVFLIYTHGSGKWQYLESNYLFVDLDMPTFSLSRDKTEEGYAFFF